MVSDGFSGSTVRKTHHGRAGQGKATKTRMLTKEFPWPRECTFNSAVTLGGRPPKKGIIDKYSWDGLIFRPPHSPSIADCDRIRVLF
jgi:hypothetical protein